MPSIEHKILNTERDELITQRDALREALKELIKEIETRTDGFTTRTLDKARSALKLSMQPDSNHLIDNLTLFISGVIIGVYIGIILEHLIKH